MDVDALKEQARHGWSLGEYAPISALLRPAASVLVDECAISAGQEVLDAGAGDGNVAVAAAAEGASVTACDITPLMIERGRARSAAEGVDIRWVEGDVEALPFPDESFECVTSAFGLFLAPRPAVAAAEVFRVLRPGGTFGMTAWTPDGFMGRVFAEGRRFDPPQAEPVPVSTEWGDEPIARSRLEGLASSVRCERRTLRWEFASAQECWERLGSAGPAAARRRSAAAARSLEEMRFAVMGVISALDLGGGGAVVIEAEYLLTVARKRG